MEIARAVEGLSFFNPDDLYTELAMQANAARSLHKDQMFCPSTERLLLLTERWVDQR